jgi:hypothetical protein
MLFKVMAGRSACWHRRGFARLPRARRGKVHPRPQFFRRVKFHSIEKTRVCGMHLVTAFASGEVDRPSATAD